MLEWGTSYELFWLLRLGSNGESSALGLVAPQVGISCVLSTRILPCAIFEQFDCRNALRYIQVYCEGSLIQLLEASQPLRHCALFTAAKSL